MAAQHSTTTDFSSRYKFNGKELDQETGLYYYEARYYNPSVSRWLSVDPLAEKYTSFSPYNFTLDNPIMFVDPNSREIKISFRTGFLGIFGKKVTLTYDSNNQQWIGQNGKSYTGKSSKFANKVLADLKKNQENILGNEIVTNLAGDKLDHFIKKGNPNNNGRNSDNIYYYGSYKTDQKIFQGGKSGNTPGYAVLGHEMAHKYSKNLGIINNRWFGTGTNKRGVDEYNAMYYENVLRKANDLPLRMAYTEINGKLFGRVLIGSGALYRPPIFLIKRQTAPITTMPVIHAILNLKFFKIW